MGGCPGRDDTFLEKLLFVDLSKAKSFYRDGPVSGWGKHIALETAFCRSIKAPNHFIEMGRCLDGESTLLEKLLFVDLPCLTLSDFNIL